jgi:hypothetical protein
MARPPLTVSLSNGHVTFTCPCGEDLEVGPPRHEVQVHGAGRVTFAPAAICPESGHVLSLGRTGEVLSRGTIRIPPSGGLVPGAGRRLQPAVRFDRSTRPQSSAATTTEGAATRAEAPLEPTVNPAPGAAEARPSVLDDGEAPPRKAPKRKGSSA